MMRGLCVLVLFGALAGQVLAAETNKAAGSAGAEKNVIDPVERDYQRLLEADDKAQEEVDRWISENQQFAAKGGAVPAAELNRRIRERFAPVRQGYEDFLKRNPEHVKAHVAYGSFLGDTGDEEGAQLQWEKALKLDPKNPAVYNNLANVYGHIGPVKKAFEYYAKAIELSPRESTYYHNYGTTVYLFRDDAKEHFKISEDEVFAKAFSLYSNAMRLDPSNFPLASDVAQTYYGIRPMRTEEALKAWTNAFVIAHDNVEREGVQLHFARIKLMAGKYEEAHAHLDAVTNSMYGELKQRIARNLAEKENAAK